MDLKELNVRNLLFVTSNTLRRIFRCKDYPSGAEYCLLVPAPARVTPSRVYPELTADDQMFAYDLAVVCVLSKPLDGDMPSPCLLYTSPSPRDATLSRMPSSA